MKKLLCLAVVCVLFASCASTPKAASGAGATTGKVDKEQAKQVKVRVPYEKRASTYFADGSLDQYTVTEYDAAGLQKAKVRYSASGAILERTEFVYQGTNIANKVIKDADEKVISKRSFGYDASNRLVSEILEDNAGKRLSSFEYHYNDKGLRTEWVVFNAAGATIAKTVYTYQGGLIATAELQTGAGEKTGSSTYEYVSGKLARQTFFDQSGAVLRTEINTWSNGLLVTEERVNAKGELLQKVSSQYGKDGELLKKITDDRAAKNTYSQGYEYEIREELRTVKE